MDDPILSSSKTSTVFIALRDEGTPVWRPVLAICIRNDVFQILGEPLEDEIPEFVRGDLVRCEQKTFADGQTGWVGFEKVTF